MQNHCSDVQIIVDDAIQIANEIAVEFGLNDESTKVLIDHASHCMDLVDPESYEPKKFEEPLQSAVIEFHDRLDDYLLS